jgi:K+-transporting ATPase KdpF subunit
VSFDDWLGLVAALILTGYLLYVLVVPERF